MYVFSRRQLRAEKGWEVGRYAEHVLRGGRDPIMLMYVNVCSLCIYVPGMYYTRYIWTWLQTRRQNFGRRELPNLPKENYWYRYMTPVWRNVRREHPTLACNENYNSLQLQTSFGDNTRPVFTTDYLGLESDSICRLYTIHSSIHDQVYTTYNSGTYVTRVPVDPLGSTILFYFQVISVQHRVAGNRYLVCT